VVCTVAGRRPTVGSPDGISHVHLEPGVELEDGSATLIVACASSDDPSQRFSPAETELMYRLRSYYR
jgi:hypothetical protein